MKCRVVGTQSTVAIKEFKIEDFDEDAEALRACSFREVQILKELHHPNIVTYLEVRCCVFVVFFITCMVA